VNIAEIGRETRLNVPAEVLDDLQVRLAATRLPQQQAGPDWATGTPISFVSRLVERWRSGFDWRAWEERINRFNNRLVEVDGVTIHVLIEPGSGPNPLPLVLTNGWPGSFLEFLDIVDVLAHPERHGGDVADAFTVIIPSLPGYGLSPAPSGPLSPTRVAELWSKLAREILGLKRFGAYGADWGSLVTGEWARNQPEGMAGFLLTTAGGMPYLGEGAPPMCEAELAWQKLAMASNAREGAYQVLQATKPQSLAYGHTDSPAALAAWIGEKFRGWSQPDENGDPPLSLDELIANVMLYWLNGAIAPMWLYTFLGELAKPQAEPRRSEVPGGFFLAPGDLIPPAPREWIARTFSVQRYTLAAGGGHFPGYDNAGQLVSELREFFKPLR